MRSLLLSLLMLLGFQAFGQVTIDVNTLPEVGDVLEFRSFANFEGDSTYRDSGENLSWSFDEFMITGNTEISYPGISGGLDTIFPEATLTLNVGGFGAAGIRTDSTIEVIGVGGGQLMGFDFNPQRFPEPFVEIQRPLNFGDSYEDSVDLPFSLPSSAVGLDSLEIPLATIDSIRIVSQLFKSETVDAWGNLSVWDNDFPVLKVTRLDSFELGIEIGITPIFGGFQWLSLEDLIPLLGGLGGVDIDSLAGPGFGQPMGSTTYSFFTPDRKEAILEFQENEFTPPMGGEPIRTVSGLISADVTSSLDDFENGPTLTLAPNPVTDRLILTTEATGPFNSLQVIDLQGKILVNRKNFDHRQGLDVSSYDSGTYMMVVGTDEGYITKKFVVANRQ